MEVNPSASGQGGGVKASGVPSRIPISKGRSCACDEAPGILSCRREQDEHNAIRHTLLLSYTILLNSWSVPFIPKLSDVSILDKIPLSDQIQWRRTRNTQGRFVVVFVGSDFNSSLSAYIHIALHDSSCSGLHSSP